MTIDLCAHHGDDFSRLLPPRTRCALHGLRVPPPTTGSGAATTPAGGNDNAKTWLARGSPHTTWPCTGPPG